MTYAFRFGGWSAPPSFIIWEYDSWIPRVCSNCEVHCLKQKHLDFLIFFRNQNKDSWILQNGSRNDPNWVWNSQPKPRLAKQKIKWEDLHQLGGSVSNMDLKEIHIFYPFDSFNQQVGPGRGAVQQLQGYLPLRALFAWAHSSIETEVVRIDLGMSTFKCHRSSFQKKNKK